LRVLPFQESDFPVPHLEGKNFIFIVRVAQVKGLALTGRAFIHGETPVPFIHPAEGWNTFRKKSGLAGLRIRYERDGKYISTDEKSAGKNQQAFLLPSFLLAEAGIQCFQEPTRTPGSGCYRGGDLLPAAR